MRAVTIDSDLATLFTFTPRKPPITPIQGVPRLRQTENALLSDDVYVELTPPPHSSPDGGRPEP